MLGITLKAQTRAQAASPLFLSMPAQEKKNPLLCLPCAFINFEVIAETGSGFGTAADRTSGRGGKVGWDRIIAGLTLGCNPYSPRLNSLVCIL